jgi:hypothetical protein
MLPTCPHPTNCTRIVVGRRTTRALALPNPPPLTTPLALKAGPPHRCHSRDTSLPVLKRTPPMQARGSRSHKPCRLWRIMKAGKEGSACLAKAETATYEIRRHPVGRLRPAQGPPLPSRQSDRYLGGTVRGHTHTPLPLPIQIIWTSPTRAVTLLLRWPTSQARGQEGDTHRQARPAPIGTQHPWDNAPLHTARTYQQQQERPSTAPNSSTPCLAPTVSPCKPSTMHH